MLSLNKHINVIYARNLNANLMIKTGNVRDLSRLEPEILSGNHYIN